MSLARLRLAAARRALGLLTTEEMVRTARDLLADGVYSDSLGELATTERDPALRDVEPLLPAALRELGIPEPAPEEAIARLVKQAFRELLEAAPDPCDWARRFYEQLVQPLQFGPFKGLVEDCGLRPLISCHHDMEMFASFLEAVEGMPPTEAAQHLGTFRVKIARFCRAWLLYHAQGRLNPAWLNANGGLAVALARGIAKDRAFDRLPILGDALEEAGCTDEEVLEHCHAGGRHVRCCWAVDLVLNRS
jgi:hypothetical protein